MWASAGINVGIDKSVFQSAAALGVPVYGKELAGTIRDMCIAGRRFIAAMDLPCVLQDFDDLLRFYPAQAGVC